MEDGGADEACGPGEDEMHFADGSRSQIRQEEIPRGIHGEKWERGTLSWVLSIEGVTEMQRSKAEVRGRGEAAASVLC